MIYLLLRIERVEMSAQINIPEFSNNIFLINTEGCKIPKLDPYDPLIKARLNNGTELKCAYFFTLSAHLSSTFVLVGTKENTFV
jgi:hypothetical protein